MKPRVVRSAAALKNALVHSRLILTTMLVISAFGNSETFAQTAISDFVLVTPDKMPVSVEAHLDTAGDKLVIKGNVIRHCEPKKILWGHIDVTVMAESGEKILDDSIAYRPNPVVQRRSAISHFEWPVPAIVTPGSRIELHYRAGVHASQ